ncbi:MAG TPA: RlmE family RNA methyltransferase [Hypericibacter adhaerens]|jgi:23S rRNA (uridine2552-2'-O)-methyltransferase|uniref:Ribosomal RNA large subunit methyltransferase E n=1 Tax=Hypericibacter adhaerens TaxID=2602016 RepID=A0A5J6N037_9PROT|nr:RlmE family RNA methyltransferase [Hypericibacter adhaerens]QEX23352.1 ribosomal RNA large subunit methyltransferase E [Hypericibacter adhaerens]HWA43210.1 RlmE family RNA methyltransferase [Hypericibacter adhaerens]
MPKDKGPSGRQAKVRVKTANKRSVSSARWLERQLNDPYVAEARRRGLRSRAAFKLIELDDKYKLLRKGARVLDLGAAPGGWSQVAAERVGPGGRVLAVDILPMDALPGVTVMQQDFMADEAPAKIRAALDGPADLVLSDMAAPTIGHSRTDHLRIMALAETAYQFAAEVLAPGGAFLCKLFQGGATKDLLDLLKRDFETVRHVKPPASRADSAEIYVIATGFRGGNSA